MEGILVFKNEPRKYDSFAPGKQHSNEFQISTDKRKWEILELNHANMCAPM